jgi:FkbH-like protein
MQSWQLADLPLHRLITAGRRVSVEHAKRSIRVAVLGDAATQHYAEALSSNLKMRGWWPEIYEAEYDSIVQETLDPGSGLFRHEPQFVVFFNVSQALFERFSRSDPSALLDEVVEGIQSAWSLVASRTNATILQHNFALPLTRPYGNSTNEHTSSFSGFVMRLNGRLVELARAANVKLIDTEFQSAFFGKRQWFDERLWCQARQGLSPSYIPPLVKAVADSILCELGVTIKCVIVDLDNTLWGGILADDGMDKIEVGQTEVGLAFSRFQLALKELAARGILLAVCSKNNQQNVLEVIDQHPDMMLRVKDFACIVANFGDKVNNILAIRDRLNIGMDSIVFLDDTPFERELVRKALPELQVPDLPEDPADFVAEMARWNLFEGKLATPEDLARLSYYQADAARDAVRAKYTGLADFLADLNMRAEIAGFDDFTLPRAHQLVQRSNQFNLTTRRYSHSELATMARDPDVSAFCIRLHDRLGDNGVIAVVILRREARSAIVDTWIMSCRVLGRQVEDLTLRLIVDRARLWECDKVVGHYLPTAKNALVADLYPRLGFSESDQTKDGQVFEMPVADYRDGKLLIEVIEPERTD